MSDDFATRVLPGLGLGFGATLIGAIVSPAIPIVGFAATTAVCVGYASYKIYDSLNQEGFLKWIILSYLLFFISLFTSIS